MSALSGVGDQSSDPVMERAIYYIYEHINQFYNFKGLHEFKEKFHPHWSPRDLVYPGLARLPMILTALARAAAGNDVIADYFYELLIGASGFFPQVRTWLCRPRRRMSKLQ